MRDRNESPHRQTGLLRQTLRLAQERGTLPNAIKVRRLPEHNARQGFLERADLEALVAALPDDLQDFTRFAYMTAWRRGEVATLRWSDIDRAGAVIRLRPERSKNGCGRAVAIEGDLGAIIERRAHARVIPGRAGEPERIAELVFHRGSRAIRDFRGAWATACLEAGIYRVDGTNPDGSERRVLTRLFHDLRRSGVRNMVRAGVRERVAMEVSGHKTRAVFDRYNITSERGSPLGYEAHDSVRQRAADAEQCHTAAPSRGHGGRTVIAESFPFFTESRAGGVRAK